MNDYSKRLLAWFAVMWLCFGGCLAVQYFTGYPRCFADTARVKLLQLQEGKR